MSNIELCPTCLRPASLRKASEIDVQSRQAETDRLNAFVASMEASVCHAVGVEPVAVRLSTLETENKDLRARVAELEAREKQRAEDEEWAHRHAVPIHRRGDAWVAEHFDGHRILEAEAASIHGALRALREKVEARPTEKATPCPHCLRVECECSEFDVCPDMGDK